MLVHDMADSFPDAATAAPAPPAPTSTAPAPRGRRADARLNMDAIVRAASGLLADAPRASMQEVASAAGLHRATVHRHFPSRDDLLTAVRDHAFAAATRRMAEDAAAPGEPLDVLRGVVRGQIEVNEQFRLYRYVPLLESRREADRPDRLRPLQEVVERAQSAGVVRDDLAPEALAVALAGLVSTTLPELSQGRMTVDEATDFCLVLLTAA